MAVLAQFAAAVRSFEFEEGVQFGRQVHHCEIVVQEIFRIISAGMGISLGGAPFLFTGLKSVGPEIF